MIKRALYFAKRHGLRATLGRAAVAGRRVVAGGRMAIFVCALDERVLKAATPANARVERKRSQTEIEPRDLEAMLAAWNPEETRKLMCERFARGANLWLFKQDGEVAGYGWTLIGESIGPHYVSLGAKDAHLFDFFVLPKFRGRGINPALVRHILAQLAGEKHARAFIEAAEWNKPQLSSLGKTPFHRMGYARKFHAFGKAIVFWSR